MMYMLVLKFEVRRSSDPTRILRTRSPLPLLPTHSAINTHFLPSFFFHLSPAASSSCFSSLTKLNLPSKIIKKKEEKGHFSKVRKKVEIFPEVILASSPT